LLVDDEADIFLNLKKGYDSHKP